MGGLDITLALCGKGGGGSPPPTALDLLATSEGWYETDHASNIHAGGLFSQLTDLSGNGNHAVQATGSLQPARLDSAGIISAEFDNIDDRLVIASPTAALADNYATGGTFMWAGRIDGIGEVATFGFGRFYQKTGGANENIFMNTVGATQVIAFRFEHVTSDPQWQTADIAFGNHTVDVLYDKSAVSNTAIQVYLDGSLLTVGSGLTEPTPVSGAGVSVAGSSIVFGNRTASDRTFDGGFCAWAFWSRLLTPAEIAIVRARFNTKTGIP